MLNSYLSIQPLLLTFYYVQDIMINKKCAREGFSHKMLKGRIGAPIIGQRSIVICKTREGTSAMLFQRKRSFIWLRTL